MAYDYFSVISQKIGTQIHYISLYTHKKYGDPSASNKLFYLLLSTLKC